MDVNRTGLALLGRDIGSYVGYCESRLDALRNYATILHDGSALTQNRKAVAIAARRKGIKGNLVSTDLVKEATGGTPSELKRSLAKARELMGSYREFSFSELHKRGAIREFELPYNERRETTRSGKAKKKLDVKRVAQKLTYKFSSKVTGLFEVVTVYDCDTACDHYLITTDELITRERTMVELIRPGQDKPQVADDADATAIAMSGKTTFVVSKLLEVIEEMTTKQIML